MARAIVGNKSGCSGSRHPVILASITVALCSSPVTGTSAEPRVAVLSADVTFEGQVYAQELPFGVPLNIRGIATPETQEVAVSFFGFGRRFRTGRVGPREFDCFEILRVKPDTEARQERPLGRCQWVPLGIAETMEGLVDDPERVREVTRFVFEYVQPLQANRHYAFRFTTAEELTAEQETDFKKRARSVFAEELSRETSLNVNEDTFRRWQTRLFEALKEVAKSVGKDVRIEGKSYLTISYQGLTDQDRESLYSDVLELNRANRNSAADTEVRDAALDSLTTKFLASAAKQVKLVSATVESGYRTTSLTIFKMAIAGLLGSLVLWGSLRSYRGFRTSVKFEAGHLGPVAVIGIGAGAAGYTLFPRLESATVLGITFGGPQGDPVVSYTLVALLAFVATAAWQKFVLGFQPKSSTRRGTRRMRPR